ncbi:SARP family transcriptional regulator [Tepiditoga spiralis]|uniref:SARP family transcriptional regulator n=1 Tax=Tepiditoga spiralis TaxID=2108365 RepID=A0A7G1G321_9BACT|nr:hypothetical protein [Tepiditoga spiralis]BBE30788.1 SARP family transcriptional regulator [Tepiditoga spiralis]
MIYANLFGVFTIKKNEKLIKNFGSRKAQELLKYLILNKNKKISTFDIYNIFWENFDEDSAKANLNSTLYLIRKKLGITKEELYTHYNYCTFSPKSFNTDMNDMLMFYEKAQGEEDVEMKIELLKKAVNLYKDELLSENIYDMWVEYKRQYIKKIYVDILSELADLFEEKNDLTRALKYLQKGFEYDKNRDDIWLKQIALNIKAENYIASQKLYNDYKELFGNSELSFIGNIKDMYTNKKENNVQVLQGATILCEEDFELLIALEKNKREKDFFVLELSFNKRSSFDNSLNILTKKIRKVDVIMTKKDKIYIMFREIKNKELAKDSIKEKIKSFLKNENYQLIEVED